MGTHLLLARAYIRCGKYLNTNESKTMNETLYTIAGITIDVTGLMAFIILISRVMGAMP